MTAPSPAADDIRVLAPLAKLIEDIVRTTPIRLGPGGTDDLAAQLAVRTAVWIGKHVLPRTPGMAEHMVAVDAERQRQLVRWGDQHHPGGTGGKRCEALARDARRDCQFAAEHGFVTWRHILAEEVAEAFAESDPVALETELVQCAAVIAAWIADLHGRRAAVSQPGREETAADASQADALLASRCDTCRHTLNRHTNHVGCTVALCVCGRFQVPIDGGQQR